MRICLLLLSLYGFATQAEQQRIISLAPHTTELAFALDLGAQLVAVSDASDYPEAAQHLPRVASHHGVNFEAIVKLQPDLILAWQGGNKPQDLSKLARLGFTLFYSHPQQPDDIASELIALGKLTRRQPQAEQAAKTFRYKLTALQQAYKTAQPKTVFYYMWPKPLMTIGKNAWAGKLLNICRADNLFADSKTDYPQVRLEQVIKRRPQIIVAAFKTDAEAQHTFWQPWLAGLNAQITQVNPDLLHRFTPRLIDGLSQLCQAIHPTITPP